MTLYRERQKLVQAYVKQIVADYVQRHVLGQRVRRACVFCGKGFFARSVRQVFCAPTCRHGWYRGMFFPRSD